MQYIELSNILSKTDEFSINCIPLKGSVLKYLYPSPEMRTMADIDFLYDGRKTSDILLIMYALGYTANPDSPNHHTFYKEPVMNVEFHENLFKKDNDFTEFFNPGWRYSKQTGKDKPLRELTDEGFYIYLVAHTAQHFHNGGAGIRNVMDVWVYLKKYKDTLDWKYIDLEFRRAGIYNFAENLKDLADIWFGSSKASPLLDEFGDYIIRSGTYGTRANQINNTLCKEGRLSTNKLRVIFRTIFPPYEIIKSKYPNAGKYPFLLPIYWIKNDLNALINRKQDIKYWIRTISKANEKKIKDHSEFMKNCGL
ncbi:MAG TPA: hypothetical protein DD733_08290 [Clostridiales bacterium]|nr:hypothetical protein [Clostridiales bacterium]